MKNLIFLLLLTCCWSACKLESDLDPSVIEPPYFTVAYQANNQAQLKVAAGLENAYLFTDFSIGGDDVLTSTGTFSDVQCLADTCAGRLRFEFRNTQIGSVVLPESIFHLGFHAFASDSTQTGTLVYRTTFQVEADTGQGYTDFHWNFNDLYTAEGSNVTLDFPIDPNFARVTLQAQRDNGLVSTVVRTVSLATSGTLFPSVNMFISPQGNGYSLEALHSGPFAELSWNNGLTQPTFSVDSLQPAYSVTVNDASGLTAIAGLDGLPTDPGTSLRTVNFSSSTILIPILTDSLRLGTLVLQWTDQSGQVWRSDLGPQAPASSFQVLESKPYELNELGQQTWQMQVSFTCQLYNNDGLSIPFSGTGRIAVAYP
ncbi:MAG: hypothetical protein ABIQ93_07210 [Saprospiraceae bacterium]